MRQFLIKYPDFEKEFIIRTDASYERNWWSTTTPMM